MPVRFLKMRDRKEGLSRRNFLEAGAVGRSGGGYVLASSRNAVRCLPEGGRADVDLQNIHGDLRVRWFNSRNGLFVESPAVTEGRVQSFVAPDAHDWALYLQTAVVDR